MNSGVSSAPRTSVRIRPAAAAFTLIEVLLCIALLALVASLFIGGAASVLRAKEPSAVERFWEVVASARQAAVESGHPVSLEVDPETGALLMAGSKVAQQTPLPGCEVTLLSANERRSILLGGQLEETAVRRVVWFYPEGTCDAFRAQLVESGTRRTTLQIDPWTCAPVLPAPAS